MSIFFRAKASHIYLDLYQILQISIILDCHVTYAPRNDEALYYAIFPRHGERPKGAWPSRKWLPISDSWYYIVIKT